MLIDTSNEAYHADQTHLSSSALKLLLKDPAAFKLRYIDGVKEAETYKASFEDGTLTHVLILEPEMVSKYAVYPGMRKQGKLWEDFKLEHADKKCVSVPQMLRAEKLYKAHAALDVAVNLVKDGFAEHNMFGTIQGVKVKARADYIVPKQHIVDVKTTAMPSDIELFKQTVIDYGYHLSAALYLEIAKQTYGVDHEFYWEVLSKEDGQCHVYRMSEQTKLAGSILVQNALANYRRFSASGVWQSEQPKQDRSTKNYEIEEV